MSPHCFRHNWNGGEPYTCPFCSDEEPSVPVAALRALSEKLRRTGEGCDLFHATMGIGYKSAADELDAILVAHVGPSARSPQKDHP